MQIIAPAISTLWVQRQAPAQSSFSFIIISLYKDTGKKARGGLNELQECWAAHSHPIQTMSTYGMVAHSTGSFLFTGEFILSKKLLLFF